MSATALHTRLKSDFHNLNILTFLKLLIKKIFN